MASLNKKSAVVLLSSGLDSTVNFLESHHENSLRMALTFNYGQKSSEREVAKAKALCLKYGVEHLVIDLPFFKNFRSAILENDPVTKNSDTALGIQSDQDQIPKAQEVSIDNYHQSVKTAQRVWVPNRNGIFLNIAAGFAENLGCEWVIPGFNAEEAVTFADNSQAYLSATDQAFSYSTSNKVKTFCYTTDMNKTEIARKGKMRGLIKSDLWICYEGASDWCGQCESCQRGLRALSAAGIE